MSTTAVYCDRLIKKEISHGHIIIDPFNQEQLGNCSYDLTLSEYFFRERIPPIEKATGRPQASSINPWSERDVARQWVPAKVEVATASNAASLGLQAGDKYIHLAPFESILAATEEFVGTLEHITGMIKTRSTAGRGLLSVCDGAGWGDVGYVNRWTLIVRNNSRFNTIILPIGASIAQIVFLETGTPARPYSGKYRLPEQGNLSGKELISRLRNRWSPEMMLPQAYKEASSLQEKKESPRKEPPKPVQVKKEPYAFHPDEEEDIGEELWQKHLLDVKEEEEEKKNNGNEEESEEEWDEGDIQDWDEKERHERQVDDYQEAWEKEVTTAVSSSDQEEVTSQDRPAPLSYTVKDYTVGS